MSFRQGARQFFERRGAPTPPLPYDAEVEYLESTGTQYINTGITPRSGLDFTVRHKVTEIPDNNTGNFAVFGSQSGRIWFVIGKSTSFGVYCGAVSSQFNRYYINNTDQMLTFDTTNWHVATLHFESGSRMSYIDIDSLGRNTISSSSATQLGSVFLFGANGASAVNILKCKVSNFSVVDFADGTEILNLVPVRFTNEQGVSEGAMYDRVSGALFRNAGTGAFLYGNDKS